MFELVVTRFGTLYSFIQIAAPVINYVVLMPEPIFVANFV